MAAMNKQRTVDFRTLVMQADGKSHRDPVTVYRFAGSDRVDEYPNGKKVVRINTRKQGVKRI